LNTPLNLDRQILDVDRAYTHCLVCRKGTASYDDMSPKIEIPKQSREAEWGMRIPLRSQRGGLGGAAQVGALAKN